MHPQEGVIVRAPVKTTPAAISRILKDKESWLKKQMVELAGLCPRREYTQGDVIPVLGSPYTLRLFELSGSVPRIQWSGRYIDVYQNFAGEARDRDAVRSCLVSLLRAKAKTWFPKRVELLNSKFFGFPVKRITVKDQTRILGSCSSLGNLNFCWRLIMAPEEVADYVIIHELAHLKEMNHSKDFWLLVEKACPEYRGRLAWLKRMGRSLYI